MAKTPEINNKATVTRNAIINGNFDFWQRGTSFASVTTEVYTTDRWLVGRTTGTATTTVSRNIDVPINTSAIYSLNVAVNTAQASFATTDRYGIIHRLEGNIFKNLRNTTATLSFWVKGSTPGIYSLGLYNLAGSTSLVSTYTINSSNTWEKKTIKINFRSATGTFNLDNTMGLGIYFTLASGPTVQTSTLNTWTNNFNIASINQTNMMATSGNYIRFSQIQLVEGVEDIAFRLAGLNYSNELSLCQRYYEKSYDIDTNPGTITFSSSLVNVSSGTGVGAATITPMFKTPKRVAPSNIITYNPLTGATSSFDRNGTPLAAGVPDLVGINSFRVSNSVTTVDTTNHYIHYTADAEL